MATRSILDLSTGECGRIGKVEGTGSVRQRLLDMGLLPQVVIRLERFALGGAPVWIELHGTHLALRREEAAMVLVTASDDSHADANHSDASASGDE